MKAKIKALATVPVLVFSLFGCSSTSPSMAIGNISSELLAADYPAFSSKNSGFIVNDSEKNIIKSWPEDINFEVYFGTWCHDSVREVPKLLKVLDGKFSLTLIALDYRKSEPKGRAKIHNVKYTPTIIVLSARGRVGADY